MTIRLSMINVCKLIFILIPPYLGGFFIGEADTTSTHFLTKFSINKFLRIHNLQNML